MLLFYPLGPALGINTNNFSLTLTVSNIIVMRLLQNALFCPISVSGSNFNPQNTQCIPVVKIFAFLELEQN